MGREEGLGWGTRVYLWWIHVDIWQNQYNIVKLKKKRKEKNKGDQPWVFFGRNDAKSQTPVLWPPHEKSWFIGKDSDAGRDWGQEEKGMTEDEMAGWHHRLDGRESEWTPGVGDGQGGLACCDSWRHKEADTTEQLNWTEKPNHSKSLVYRLISGKGFSLKKKKKTIM